MTIECSLLEEYSCASLRIVRLPSFYEQEEWSNEEEDGEGALVEEEELPFVIFPWGILASLREPGHSLSLSWWDALLELDASPEPGSLPAEYCYARISRSARKVIRKRSPPVKLLTEVEVLISELLQKAEQSRMELFVEGAYQRLFLHAVCQYYGVSSATLRRGGGVEAVVLVRRPKRVSCPLPSEALLSFLVNRMRIK